MIRILKFTGINETNYEKLQEMVAHVKLPAVPDYIIHHSKHFYDAALYHIFIPFVFGIVSSVRAGQPRNRGEISSKGTKGGRGDSKASRPNVVPIQPPPSKVGRSNRG